MPAPLGDLYHLAVGSGSLADSFDLNDGLSTLVEPGSFNAPPPIHRQFHSRSRQAEIKLDPERIVDFTLILTAGDPDTLWQNYRAIERKLLEAEEAFQADGPTDLVCLWAKPATSAGGYVYFDIKSGQITILADDYGGSPFIRAHVSLICLPWLRSDPQLLGPWSLTADATGHQFISGLLGDTEGLLDLTILDTSPSGVIQSVRVGLTQGDDLVAADSTFVLPADMDSLPGNLDTSPFFYGSKHTGDASAINGQYARKTVGSSFGALAAFKADYTTPARYEGVYDLWARVRSPAAGNGGVTTPVSGLAFAGTDGTGTIAGYTMYAFAVPYGADGREFPYYASVITQTPASTSVTKYYYTFTLVPGAVGYHIYQYIGPSNTQNTAIWTVYVPSFNGGASRWEITLASPYTSLYHSDSRFPQQTTATPTGVAGYKALLRVRAGVQATDSYNAVTTMAVTDSMAAHVPYVMNTLDVDWHFVYVGQMPLPPTPTLEDGSVPPWIVILEAETTITGGQQIDCDSLWLLRSTEPQSYLAYPTFDLPAKGEWHLAATREQRGVGFVLNPTLGSYVAAMTPRGAPLIGRPNCDLCFMVTQAGDISKLAATFTVSGSYTPRYWYYRGQG